MNEKTQLRGGSRMGFRGYGQVSEVEAGQQSPLRPNEPGAHVRIAEHWARLASAVLYMGGSLTLLAGGYVRRLAAWQHPPALLVAQPRWHSFAE